ncbi:MULTISPECIES: glycosyltransferase family 4 protein [Haloferax]|uniref:Glycosyltransferase n=2 Tax=Haloferax TaxID=2251 RepID=A0A6G1Z6T6_9EURY|nr:MULTISPECIES: glycosyltransferase family 4 protein [Haloferax]KAB1185478.1 glycosyltransferase family 4 protein [Haloferax sp. CBA1149]MRW82128.1 glycosyltransferase [Haloferax marinisediminis]
MHVVYVIGQSSGGLPHYAAELANAMTEHADVTVLKPSVTSADDLFAEEVDVLSVFEPISISMPEIYKLDLDPRKVYRGLSSYDNIEIIRDLDADLVHDPTGLFPQMKFFIKIHGIDKQYPFVTTRHEVPPNPFSLSRPPVFVESVVDLLIPNLDEQQSIVHTKRQKEVLVNRGYPQELVRVIPHGVYSVFGSAQENVAEPEPNTLLFFGNIVPPKGLNTLVKAIPQVAREIPDVKLIIAGDGKISSDSQRIIDNYEKNFEVHNRFIENDKVNELFSRAEVVTTPYRSQQGTKGHSGVVATAFSFGKPIVASTASEFPELVGESGAGVVVPPDDPHKLATAIIGVLKDDEAREEMSKRSLEMADRLSWENVAKQYLDVYRQIIDNQSSEKRIYPVST